MVEQPLCLVRRQVTSMLGDGPPILPWQITHQPGQVLLRLRERLHPGEAGPQPPVQLGQVRDRPLTLYDDSRSRLADLVRHNMMILGRLSA
jgi:hypothetical protein